MHTVFALLCFVVVIHWLIFPYPSGLLHWHCGNLTIAPVPAKQPWWIWINTSCEFIMNDCITTTKQSTTKPCAYFLGYTVWGSQIPDKFSMDITPAYEVETIACNPSINSTTLELSNIETGPGRPTDCLVREIRRCCPRANIVVNKIPPRGHDETVMQKIAMVNTYISNMAREKKFKVYCRDPCPKMYKYFAKDEVHFNNSRKQFFAYSISQEICTRFLLCCALLWLYIDWFSHIHQAYFTGTVAI